MGFIYKVIVIVIAISVIQRMVRTALKFFAAFRAQTSSQASEPRLKPNNTGTTVLQQDPVCGTYVSTETSLKRIVNGSVLHFCSTECRDKYSVPA